MKDKTILLVEDNPDDEELARRAFRAANISNQLAVARDGAEALDYLFGMGTHSARDLTAMPTLVPLDLNLPKVDGFEVLSRERADPRTNRLPVIILTTSRDQEEVIKVYDRCCNGYVRKPVESAQLREVVSQLGLFWLLHNVPLLNLYDLVSAGQHLPVYSHLEPHD